MRKLIFILFIFLLQVGFVNAQDCPLNEGFAYKTGFSSTVYYITNQCTKRPFDKSDLFFSYFDSWDDVNVVSSIKLGSIDDDQLGFMPWGPKYDPKYGALVKIVNDSKVYLLLGNEKYWISSENVFDELNYSWNWIEDISDLLLDKYEVGSEINYTNHHPNYTLIKYIGSSDVYRLEPDPNDEEQQIKVRIKNEEEFNKLGFRWDRIVTISLSEQYSDGGVLSLDSDCGNNFIDQDEECDGETYCNESCKISSQYQKVPSFDQGSYTDYTVAVGQKMRVDDQINIRIDSIIEEISDIYGSEVRYSVWGKDNGNICRLMSTAGVFWTNDEDYKFREFTNSFVELIGVSDNTVDLRVYTGGMARERCEQISGWKKNIACSFYPTNDTYYIQNDKFRIYLNDNYNKDYAHYIIDALSNCYLEIAQKIPGIYNITPFGDRWAVYPMINENGAFSADYQRISIGSEIPPYVNSIPDLFSEIENGKCPMEKAYIPHELTHLLFSNTMLQDVYDGGSKSEFASNKPGSMNLSEGLANFIPYYISKNILSPSIAYDYKISETSVCGKNSLVNYNNKYNGATQDQLKYSEIMAGKGHKSNHYEAGFCFFKRVEDDCGESSLDYLFEKQLLFSGSMQSQITIFSRLSQICGQEKIENIMSDFGFSHDLLDVEQQNPRGGFKSDLNILGCF